MEQREIDVDVLFNRIQSLEKWLKDLGMRECDYCLRFVPTSRRGDLRICERCRERGVKTKETF